MTDPLQACGWLWIFWLAYWLVTARKTAPVAVPEPRLQRLQHTIPSALVAVLLCNPSWARGGVWLAGSMRWAGFPVTAAGIGFSVWARRHLGRYWSGEVVLKEGHELIRTGPYALARHPIYTGVLLAILGTAIAGGRACGLAALVLGVIVFERKRRREETLLESRFGDRYRDYRREVPALIPRL